MGKGFEYPTSAQAEPNPGADGTERPHVAPDIGAKRPTGECHSHPAGAPAERDGAHSLPAYDLSYLAAPCTGGHLTQPKSCLCPWPRGNPQWATRSGRGSISSSPPQL